MLKRVESMIPASMKKTDSVDVDKVDKLVAGVDDALEEFKKLIDVGTEDIATREKLILLTRKLKAAWRRGKYIQKERGAKTSEEAKLIIALPHIEEILRECPIYVTDAVGAEVKAEAAEDFEEEEGRELISSERMRQLAEFVKQELQEIAPDEDKAREAVEQLSKLLFRFVAKIEGRKIVTRPGIAGVLDIIDDALIRESVMTDIREENGGQIPLEITKDIVRLITLLEGLCERKKLESIDVRRRENLPMEIRVILSEHPELESEILSLTDDGVALYSQTKTRTEGEALEAIRRISEYSQENFILSWLPALIERGKTPVVTISKSGLEKQADAKMRQEKLKSQIQEQEAALGILRGEYSDEELAAFGKRRKLTNKKKQGELIDRKFEKFEVQAAADKKIEEMDERQLAESVEIIRASVGGFKKIVALDDRELSPDQKAKLDKINKGLAGINIEYARRRMIFDNADERTNEAQKILRMMAIVGPVAHGLEMLELGMLAKLFASSTDDLMGEWAEIQALLGSGFSTRAVVQRLKVAVPVFGAATGAAAAVETLLASGHNVIAGATFGVSAVALSLTTALQSMKMYYENYLELVKEGKVEDKAAVLRSQEEFQKRIAEFEDCLKHNRWEKLIEIYEQVLAEIPVDILSEEERQTFLSKIKKMDKKELSRLISPSRIRQEASDWWKAIEQDFSNPARLGILLGASVAPIGGMAAGAAGFMHCGLVLAGIGSIESIVGGVWVSRARRQVEKDYQAMLLRRLKTSAGSRFKK